MTAFQLKTQLKRLIENEKDISLLEHALRFFKRADQEELWKAKLSSRADKAEADFEAGRVNTHAEVIAHFKAKRTK
jgi:predicted transcriptional regulator